MSEPPIAKGPTEPQRPVASWVREEPSGGEGDLTLEENWLFRLRRERFRSRASGRVHGFYVMHLADVVNVVALTPERRLVMVRQFRAGSGRDSLETPGGLLEPGEDPLAAGARELLEETGYAGDPPVRLGTVWSNSSIMTSRTTTVVIANARRVAAPKLDPNEELTIEFVPASAIPRMIQNGEIDHALVVAGLLWWLEWQFPGRLAVPTPARWTIAKIMQQVAVFALALGLLTNIRSVPGMVLSLVAFAAIIAWGWFLVWTWRVPRR